MVSHSSIEIIAKLMSFVEYFFILTNSKPDLNRRKDFRNIPSIAQGILTEPYLREIKKTKLLPCKFQSGVAFFKKT